jgi:hypothetical protein
MSEYQSIQDAIKFLERFPEIALEVAEPAMENALIFLHGQLPEYPPPPAASPDGVSFMTDKQRAWFFAAVKRGDVPGWRQGAAGPEKVGSARTGNLGRKFTEAVERTDAGVFGQLGTNVPYAPWVVGPDYPGETINGKTMYQARIHQNRWWQFYAVMSENMEKTWEEFEESFWPIFLARIGGAV